MEQINSRDEPDPRRGVMQPTSGSRPVTTARRRHVERVSEFAPSARRINLWGVIIPTNRRLNISSGLALGCRLATDHQANFVVLRSGEAAEQPFPRAFVPEGPRPTAVIDLPPADRQLLPVWACDRNEISTTHRKTDVGLKRNLGLALARLCGLGQAVMFVDDDMAPPHSQPAARSAGWADSLRVPDALAAFAASPSLQLAAWYATDFPDHSVVFHARRLAGYPMGGFLSGGLMMMRIDGPKPMFSASYGEDWQAILHVIQSDPQMHPSGAVRYVGEARQNAFDPFRAPRARSEELGDLVGESSLLLADLSRERAYVLSTSPEFWADEITRRIAMLVELRERLVSQVPDASGPYRLAGDDWRGTVTAAVEAVEAAIDVYTPRPQRWAPIIARFVRELAQAHSEFSDLLDGLTPAGPHDVLDLEEAVDALGLTPYVSWHGGGGRRQGPTSRSGGRRAS